MATFLNFAFVDNFSIIFVFLFVYALVYGLMELGKPFGKIEAGKGLNALIALGASVLVVTVRPVVEMIRFLIPWFLILALVIFMILFSIRIFIGDASYADAIFKKKQVTTWIIVAAIVILLFGFGRAFGQSSLEQGSWSGANQSTVSDAQFGDDDYGADDFIDDTGVGNSNVDGSRVATSNYSTNLLNTIVNPKVLGLIFVMLVGVFAMFFLSD